MIETYASKLSMQISVLLHIITRRWRCGDGRSVQDQRADGQNRCSVRQHRLFVAGAPTSSDDDHDGVLDRNSVERCDCKRSFADHELDGNVLHI